MLGCFGSERTNFAESEERALRVKAVRPTAASHGEDVLHGREHPGGLPELHVERFTVRAHHGQVAVVLLRHLRQLRARISARKEGRRAEPQTRAVSLRLLEHPDPLHLRLFLQSLVRISCAVSGPCQPGSWAGRSLAKQRAAWCDAHTLVLRDQPHTLAYLDGDRSGRVPIATCAGGEKRAWVELQRQAVNKQHDVSLRVADAGPRVQSVRPRKEHPFKYPRESQAGRILVGKDPFDGGF